MLLLCKFEETIVWVDLCPGEVFGFGEACTVVRRSTGAGTHASIVEIVTNLSIGCSRGFITS